MAEQVCSVVYLLLNFEGSEKAHTHPYRPYLRRYKGSKRCTGHGLVTRARAHAHTPVHSVLSGSFILAAHTHPRSHPKLPRNTNSCARTHTHTLTHTHSHTHTHTHMLYQRQDTIKLHSFASFCVNNWDGSYDLV